MELLERTWVDPLHAVWVSVVVAHSESTVSDDVRSERRAVQTRDGTIGV